MAIHQNGNAVACAIDYEGIFTVGNVEDNSVEFLWAELGKHLRKHHTNHDWQNIPEICKSCGDWQVAGAEYEKPTSENTRPFWYSES